jgi:hypothetical protein
MEAAAAHAGAEQWRPPSSFGFNSAPGSPAGTSSYQTHRSRHAQLPPRLSLLAPLDENAAAVPPAGPLRAAAPSLAPDAVWRAVMDVAESMPELFGGDDGVDVRQSSGERAQGWACPACGRRFAFQDLALAQACEASHAGVTAHGRRDALASARRRLGRGSSSDGSESSDDDAAGDGSDADDDAAALEASRRRRQAGSPRARRSLQAGMRAAGPGEAPPMTWQPRQQAGPLKWGGAPRDPGQAADAAARIAAGGGLTSDGWTEAAILGATPPATPPASSLQNVRNLVTSPPEWRQAPGLGSPAPGVRGGGRVQTSADVLPPERGGKRRGGCSVRAPSCAAPGAGSCVLQ